MFFDVSFDLPYIARSGRGVTTFPMSHITGLGTRLTEGVRSESSGREGAGSCGESHGHTQGETGKRQMANIVLPINERMQRWVRQVSATRARERGDHVVLMELAAGLGGGRAGGGDAQTGGANGAVYSCCCFDSVHGALHTHAVLFLWRS